MILKLSSIFLLFLGIMCSLHAIRPGHSTSLALVSYSRTRINDSQERLQAHKPSPTCLKVAAATGTGSLCCIASGVLFSALLPVPVSVLLAFAVGLGSAGSTYVGMEALEECKKRKQEEETLL